MLLPIRQSSMLNQMIYMKTIFTVIEYLPNTFFQHISAEFLYLIRCYTVYKLELHSLYSWQCILPWGEGGGKSWDSSSFFTYFPGPFLPSLDTQGRDLGRTIGRHQLFICFSHKTIGSLQQNTANCCLTAADVDVDNIQYTMLNNLQSFQISSGQICSMHATLFKTPTGWITEAVLALLHRY